LVTKGDIFTPFCYKFIQVAACQKTDILDLSLSKLLQTNKGAIFYATHCTTMNST